MNLIGWRAKCGSHAGAPRTVRCGALPRRARSPRTPPRLIGARSPQSISSKGRLIGSRHCPGHRSVPSCSPFGDTLNISRPWFALHLRHEIQSLGFYADRCAGILNRLVFCHCRIDSASKGVRLKTCGKRADEEIHDRWKQIGLGQSARSLYVLPMDIGGDVRVPSIRRVAMGCGAMRRKPRSPGARHGVCP